MSTAPYPIITAKIIADSIGILSHYTTVGEDVVDAAVDQSIIAPRLTTFEVTYPRYIHAEIMTHRQLSRNAQSSRAIPVKRRLERVRSNPVMPIRWEKNQSGMQSKSEEVDDPQGCSDSWLSAAETAAHFAEELANAGLHKQWANRGTEPYDTITVILTGTHWENFFGLRCHPAAQPEFQNLAWKMADLYYNERPRSLKPGEWHLPYIREEDFGNPICDLEAAVKVSTARCARVSYLNHDGTNTTIEKDIELHDRLLSDGHMSPFEHAAEVAGTRSNMNPNPDVKWWGNFSPGWIQYRKLLPREVKTFDYDAACADRPWTEPYTGPEA